MIAICTPARRLASVDWAATPTITPMIPAAASLVAATRSGEAAEQEHGRGVQHEGAGKGAGDDGVADGGSPPGGGTGRGHDDRTPAAALTGGGRADRAVFG